MDRADLVGFPRKQKLAVVATVAAGGVPQAAVVGFAVTDDLEVVFDTLTTTRKYRNALVEPRVAAVIGWDDEVTVQLEGVVDFPAGAELERIRDCYFAVYPDGRERLTWPGIVHARLRPAWIRYSDFRRTPPRIVEIDLARLS